LSPASTQWGAIWLFFTRILAAYRFKLSCCPGELTRPQNRPTLRLRQSPEIERLTTSILTAVAKLSPVLDPGK
jgi:hypothetical protein